MELLIRLGESFPFCCLFSVVLSVFAPISSFLPEDLALPVHFLVFFPCLWRC